MIAVREGGLAHPATVALLQAHFDDMLRFSPPGMCHFLDLDALATEDVTFLTAWDGQALLGCGALKRITPDHGEIKSMRTADAARRRGVAGAILVAIVARAREQAMTRLSLETGSGDAFAAAERLYRSHGFEWCAPFGNYVETSFNRFMTRAI